MKRNVFGRPNDLFTDPQVLEYEYIPETIKFRETQTKAIKQNILPAFRGTCPINMILQGPPGTGKTATVKHIFEDIRRQTAQIIPVFINCQIIQTEFRVFHAIYQAVLHQEPPLHGVPTQHLIEALGRKCSQTGNVIIICLDDANAITHSHILDKVLCRLLRLHEKFPGVKIGIIATLNTTDASITRHISKPVNSVFMPYRICFPPYRKREIHEIMKDRVRTGISPGVISLDILNTVVQEIGEEGDLRMGIGILKCSVDLAGSDNRTSVTPPDVQTSIPLVREMHLNSAVSILKEEEQEMLETIETLIRQHGEQMSIKDLHREVEETTKKEQMGYSKFTRILKRYHDLGLITIARPLHTWGNTREIFIRRTMDTHKKHK